jgi:hypothetical protein
MKRRWPGKEFLGSIYYWGILKSELDVRSAARLAHTRFPSVRLYKVV